VFLADAVAAAQSPLPNVVVVETPEGVDAEALRAAIGRELGAIAVGPTDPRGASRSGTVRVKIDPTRGELVVEYEERPRVITRTVPIPANPDAVVKSAVFLAGNLARNEAADLTWALRQSAPPTAPPEPKPTPGKARSIWIGAAAEMDVMSLPAELHRNICFAPTLGYYCTDQNGDDISSIPPGGFYVVEGDFGVRNGRFLLSLDDAVTDNWMVGLRIGFVAQRYRGSRAPHQDFTMGPVHVEARGLYAFGDHPFVEGVAPYTVLAVGAAQYDAKENAGQPVLFAWKVYGPLFASFGFGFRWAVSPDVAIVATPAKITIAFPYETAIVWSPEIATQVGF
jgi:hypothetical protein